MPDANALAANKYGPQHAGSPYIVPIYPAGMPQSGLCYYTLINIILALWPTVDLVITDVTVEEYRFTSSGNLRRLPELIKQYSSTVTKPLAVRAT